MLYAGAPTLTPKAALPLYSPSPSSTPLLKSGSAPEFLILLSGLLDEKLQAGSLMGQASIFLAH